MYGVTLDEYDEFDYYSGYEDGVSDERNRIYKQLKRYEGLLKEIELALVLKVIKNG
jgi:hypothetical protein